MSSTEDDHHHRSQSDQSQADKLIDGQVQRTGKYRHGLFVKPDEIYAEPGHTVEHDEQPEGKTIKLFAAIGEQQDKKDEQSIE